MLFVNENLAFSVDWRKHNGRIYSVRSVSTYVCGWVDGLEGALIDQMREGWQRRPVKWEGINKK